MFSLFDCCRKNKKISAAETNKKICNIYLKENELPEQFSIAWVKTGNNKREQVVMLNLNLHVPGTGIDGISKQEFTRFFSGLSEKVVHRKTIDVGGCSLRLNAVYCSTEDLAAHITSTEIDGAKEINESRKLVIRANNFTR